MENKVILITGGVSGIGYETVKDLLQRGARVTIADWNMVKGREILQELYRKIKFNKNNVRLMKCDLSSFKSVRKFVETFNNEEDKLDVLICNAGIAWSKHLITDDGFNTVIQVNYLSHFLLTNLLLNKLKQSRSSRIVFVTSGAHRVVRSINWSDAFTQFKNFRLWGPYPVSKAFMLLFAYKLKQDLKSEHIDVFAVNPSWVWTSIQSPMREAIGLILFLIFYPVLYLLKCILSKTPKAGAQTTLFCAVEHSLRNSSDFYFENCTVEVTSSLCRNELAASHLWNLSCEAAGIYKQSN